MFLKSIFLFLWSFYLTLFLNIYLEKDFLLAFTSSDYWDISWPRPAVKYDWSLYPGDKKMSSLSWNFLLNSSKSVKKHSSMPSLNCNYKPKKCYSYNIMQSWFGVSKQSCLLCFITIIYIYKDLNNSSSKSWQTTLNLI